MGSLDQLRAKLPRERGPVFPQERLTELERQIEELTVQLKGRTPSAPEDAIREAVERFIDEPRFRDSRDALLVALGCDRPVGTKHYRLIEDITRFPAILVGVDRFRKHLFVFKDCYKGLLDTYLGYHPETKGGSRKAKPNWDSLRAWLNSGMTDIRDPEGLEEEWVLELVAHPELFSDRPVEAFGHQMLDGEKGVFLQFQRALGIQQTSWLMEQLVLAQIRAAGDSKAGIVAYTPKLLVLLEMLGGQNPPVFNRGLAELLTFYCAQTDGAVHSELRDFSLNFWGNPLLDEDGNGWVFVPHEPREMVKKWFKRHVIQQFFNVLTRQGELEERDAREKRKRRLNFWVQYADIVGDVKFALGPHARKDTDARMVEVLEMMKGMTLDLDGGGDRQNNAFIMRFGDWVVVEFGLENNACFVYRASDVPFEGGDTRVSAQSIRNHINNSAYQSRGPIRRVHKDVGGRTWEEIFTVELEKRGILLRRSTGSTSVGTATRWAPQIQAGTRMSQVETRPSQPHATTRSPVTPSPATTSQVATGPAPSMSHAAASGAATRVIGTASWRDPALQPPLGQKAVSTTSSSTASGPVVRLPFGPKQEKELLALCRKLDILVLDMRERGSYLWIALDKDEDTRLTPLLKSYGFNYRPGRGWYGQHSS